MLLYCVKFRKNTENKIAKVATTRNERIRLLSKCAVCDSTKSEFIKQKEANGV